MGTGQVVQSSRVAVTVGQPDWVGEGGAGLVGTETVRVTTEGGLLWVFPAGLSEGLSEGRAAVVRVALEGVG